MAAATADLNLPRRLGPEFGYPVKNGSQVFRDTLVALTADSVLVPAGTTGAVAIAGLAEHYADNRDGANTEAVKCRRGVFPLATDAAITPASLGAAVYAVDDSTVSLDSTGGRLKVGTVAGFEAGRTWVQI
jgi:hypothetical protein